MKTKIATLFFALSMFITASALANEPVPASKAVSKSVAKLIQSELEYPEFAINEKLECDVAVSLVIQADGTFDVVGANSISAKLKEYVAEQIEEIESENHARFAGQEVLVKIKFDLLLY